MTRNTCRPRWPLRSKTGPQQPAQRPQGQQPRRGSIAMAPELGVFSLILAFVLSLSQAFFGLTGAWRGKPVWMAVARPAVTGQFVFVIMAFACLVYSFVNNDFSVMYVARNSNSELPLFYKVAALWGAHEGSLLLWILILSIWSVAVAAFSRGLPLSFSSRVLGVMGLISSGFMLFTLWTSNPFLRLIPAAQDGADLNPVLQDFALSIHPPMLYTGYVGFSVAFAFACAAMLEGRLGWPAAAISSSSIMTPWFRRARSGDCWSTPNVIRKWE